MAPFTSPNTHKGKETPEGKMKTGADRNNIAKTAATWARPTKKSDRKEMPPPRRKTPQSSAATQKELPKHPAKTAPQPLAKPASKTGKGIAAGTRKVVKGK